MKKKYYIGTSGWNYGHWSSKFYPKGLAEKNWFDYYASQFDTVEINYSFYRWPTPKIVMRWHDAAPGNFIFTLKAPQLITHYKQLKDVQKLLRDFYRLGSLLKRKMGCYLFQLPPRFEHNEANEKKLKHFLKILDKQKCNVIEFRHPDWWQEDIYALFKKEKAIFATIAGLSAPKNIIVTHKIAYFRFHGNEYQGRYSTRNLKKYAEEMKGLKAERVYAYFNNDEKAYAAINAKELKGFLAEKNDIAKSRSKKRPLR